MGVEWTGVRHGREEREEEGTRAWRGPGAREGGGGKGVGGWLVSPGRQLVCGVPWVRPQPRLTPPVIHGNYTRERCRLSLLFYYYLNLLASAPRGESSGKQRDSGGGGLSVCGARARGGVVWWCGTVLVSPRLSPVREPMAASDSVWG